MTKRRLRRGVFDSVGMLGEHDRVATVTGMAGDVGVDDGSGNGPW